MAEKPAEAQVNMVCIQQTPKILKFIWASFKVFFLWILSLYIKETPQNGLVYFWCLLYAHHVKSQYGRNKIDSSL